MREMLFRGKAINRNKFREYRTNYKNGDWVYGLISKPYCERFPGIPPEMTNTNGISGIDVDYTTIGQYTGLTDKNGMKIFEGDILRSTETSDIEIVQWFPEHAAFMVWYKYLNGIGFLYKCACIVEIIGNIHDNPELLGGE